MDTCCCLDLLVCDRTSKQPLNYFSYGKPKVPVFRYAEITLLRVAEGLEPKANRNNFQQTEFECIYMIGDNPATDILGARQVKMRFLLFFVNCNMMDYFL